MQRQWSRRLVVAVLLAVSSSTGVAQAAETLEFLVPGGTPMVPGPDGHIVVVLTPGTGGIEPLVDCMPRGEVAPRPVQTAFAVDFGSGNAPFLVLVIRSDAERRIRPGTILRNLVLFGVCDVYEEYRGELVRLP